MYYVTQTVQARVHQADQVLAVSDLQTVNIALEASQSVSCLVYFAGMSSLHEPYYTGFHFYIMFITQCAKACTIP